MPTLNVVVTEHFDRLIASGVETGRYSDASEVVREGLRLLEQRDAEDRAKIAWLRDAAVGAIDSLERGEYVDLTSAEAIDGFLGDVDAEVRAESLEGA